MAAPIPGAVRSLGPATLSTAELPSTDPTVSLVSPVLVTPPRKSPMAVTEATFAPERIKALIVLAVMVPTEAAVTDESSSPGSFTRSPIAPPRADSLVSTPATCTLPSTFRAVIDVVLVAGPPNSMRAFADKTVDGLEANVERATALAGMSPSIVTPLNKLIGYEAAAKIAKHSVAKGITVREAVIDLGYVERGELTLEQLDEKLDLLSMTHPG